MRLMLKKCLAELVGTFALVFCGTGAIIINEVSGGTVTHVGIAITFGLIVLAMIYAFGDTSGAHINPAVSVAFWAAKKMPTQALFPYISAQLIGALLASLTLKLLFPTSTLLGATLPANSAMQSFVLELILTFFLMLVIIQVATGSKAKGEMAGIAIGAVVLLEALFAGPISGASMNPARSIAPALLSGHLNHLWIYLIAPILGALISVFMWKIIKD
ncbi:MAG: aquaporin [Flammeovirgaceae bacterium]